MLEHLSNRQYIEKLASRCAAPESLNSISDGSSHGFTTKEVQRSFESSLKKGWRHRWTWKAPRRATQVHRESSKRTRHSSTTKEHGVERTTTDSSLNQLEKKFRIKSSCKILGLTRDAAPKAVLSVGVANVRSPEIKKSGLSESARSDLEKKNLIK